MSAFEPARWAALSPFVDELLELDRTRREQSLAKIAERDPIIAAELRELLAAGEGAGRASFLGGTADPSLSHGGVKAGDALGPWTLVEPIGEGGMGSVWRARRSDGRFEGEAAIKLLRSGLFDAGVQERFRREGAILARLRHPGIAPLLDAGVTARGQPYLVLELVQGQRIDHHGDTRSLGLRERLALFLQVLDAVAAAHGQLVIHRDLKPSNVLVDGEGRVRLLDFGIARLLPGADSTLPALTREGHFAMTPEYAAPEQFEGGALSTATDVYALGVMLYELLTGHHPSGLRPGSAAPMGYLSAARAGDHLPASRHATPWARSLAGDLDTVLAKALKPAAVDRYQTASAMADDLRRHLAHEPVSARPDSLAYRLGRLLRRHRLASALAALAAVAALAGVGGTLQQAHRATQAAELARAEGQRALGAARESDRQRAVAQAKSVEAAREAERASQMAVQARAAAALAEREHQRADVEAADARKAAQRAEHERDRALHELDFAESTSQLMIYLLGEAGDKPFTTGELLARAAETVDRQYQSDPEQQARLLALVAFQYTQMADTARAKPLLERAYALGRQAGSIDTLAALDCQVSLNGYQSTPTPTLIATMDKAIAALRASSDQGSSTLANCLTARSLLHRVDGNMQAALADAESSLALFGKARPGQRLSAMSARSARATALGQLGRWAEGVAEYRTIVAELQAMGQGETVKAATNLHNLASQLANAGQISESAAFFRQSLALQERMGGSDSASTRVQYAEMRSRLGDATATEDAALALSEAEQHATPRGIGGAATAAASVYCRLGKPDRCEALLARARSSLEPLLPPGHPQRANLDVLQARLAMDRGQWPEAAMAVERALPVFAKAQVQGPGGLQAQLLHAQVLRRTGQTRRARETLDAERAQALRLSRGFTHSEQMGDTEFEEAQLRQAEGRRGEVSAAARAALTHYEAVLGPDTPRSRAARAMLASLGAE